VVAAAILPLRTARDGCLVAAKDDPIGDDSPSRDFLSGAQGTGREPEPHRRCRPPSIGLPGSCGSTCRPGSSVPLWGTGLLQTAPPTSSRSDGMAGALPRGQCDDAAIMATGSGHWGPRTPADASFRIFLQWCGRYARLASVPLAVIDRRRQAGARRDNGPVPRPARPEAPAVAARIPRPGPATRLERSWGRFTGRVERRVIRLYVGLHPVATDLPPVAARSRLRLTTNLVRALWLFRPGRMTYPQACRFITPTPLATLPTSQDDHHLTTGSNPVMPGWMHRTK
jgi:hypothetical protein